MMKSECNYCLIPIKQQIISFMINIKQFLIFLKLKSTYFFIKMSKICQFLSNKEQKLVDLIENGQN